MPNSATSEEIVKRFLKKYMFEVLFLVIQFLVVNFIRTRIPTSEADAAEEVQEEKEEEKRESEFNNNNNNKKK